MLTRWNDFAISDFGGNSVLNDLRQEMDQIFRRLQNELSDFPPGGLAMDAAWPRVAVQDDGDALRVTVEVPGFKPEDLTLSLEPRALTIRGERRSGEAPAGSSEQGQESAAFRFARTLTLPAHIEADEAEAKLSNGVLEVRLPKAASDRTRQITVRAA
jgi:HSP20 family protein